MYIFDVSTLVSCVPARVKDQCNFPLVWEDIWINPKQGTKVRNNIQSSTRLQSIKRTNKLITCRTQNKVILPITLIEGRGVDCACTFCRRLFLQEKRSLVVQTFVTFPNSLWTFGRSKNIFFSKCLGAI